MAELPGESCQDPCGAFGGRRPRRGPGKWLPRPGCADRAGRDGVRNPDAPAGSLRLFAPGQRQWIRGCWARGFRARGFRGHASCSVPGTGRAVARRGGGKGAPTTKFTVEAVLNAAVRGGGQPQTGKIRTSLIDAGFPAGAVEVTASRTPTGLAADAVEAAVRDGGDCIVAQIRDDGVAVSVLPALASGGCLVGIEG